jgi:hypothetical protein
MTVRSRVVVLAVCAALGLVDQVQSANYTVGQGFVEGSNGYTWTNTVNGLLKPTILEDAYKSWANSVSVVAGDTLTFEYPLGSHTVFLVPTEVAFENCDFAGAVQVPDGFPTKYTVKSTDSTLYFVCNIPGHCLQGGQKVKVTTQGRGIAPPSGPGSNAPHQASLNGVLLLVIMSSVYLADALFL